jgi:beta-glucosidase
VLLAWLIVMLLAASPAHAAGRCGNHPWCDTSLSPDVRAGLLLDALTQNEKVSLLAGDDLSGGNTGDPHGHTGTSDGIPRLGLPPVYYSDGPVGPRQGSATALPIPMALAATFDPSMAFRHGDVVGSEAKDKGNDVVFAPTVNIMRTPLGGRTFEAYGEDPYLDARMAVGWIDGAQSEGVIADVKHFAANNQEGDAGPPANLSGPGQPIGPPPALGNRMTENSVVDERTLREVYLPQFEAAVKDAHVGTIMCSYNRLNGDYACENPHLLHDILEREWGFKGYVIADYGAAHDTPGNLNGGLDFEPWPGFAYSPTLVNAMLLAGQASPAVVDEHVRRILRTLFAYGFFDRPAFADDDSQIDKPAHARTARRIEQSAITMLENRGALPLRARKLGSIAVIGKDADQFVTGGGSGDVTPFSFATPLAAIRQRAGSGVHVRYDDGSDAARAAGVARGADVALVFAGDYETEGTDRACLSLECPNTNGNQDSMIEQVAAANPNTVVVLETGGPVLTPWRDRVAGLLEAWYPGEQGGPAIASVLFGDVDPGGRLPATFPREEGDIPTAGDPEKYPGVAENVRYKEGVLVGYRWYDANGIEPAFPFGFGLSYTSFRYSRLRVKHRRVSFVVKNVGRRRGVEVPQLYLGLPSPGPGVVQPPRQLKGFQKLSLRPSQSKRVIFTITSRDISYWNSGDSGWAVAPGCYRVMVGRSSRQIVRRGRFAAGGGRCP